MTPNVRGDGVLRIFVVYVHESMNSICSVRVWKDGMLARTQLFVVKLGRPR